MADTVVPQLGYGQRAEAPIDAVNQYMRSQPWYQTLIRSFGQDPNDVHLNDAQKQAVIRAAQANGIIVDEGHDGQEVDDSGNFRAKSHALKNTLIVAGIAAAALATAGAAGVFGGAAAGGGAGAAGAGTAGTLAGIEGGAYGLGDAALASLGGGVGAAGAAGAGAAGNFIGPSTVSSVAGKSLGGKIIGTLGSDAFLRYGLPVAGGIAGDLIQAHAASNASEAEQKYLEEALAYEKQKDAGNIAREAGRYSDYRGNTQPFIAGGQSANARMLALLGLPAPDPSQGTTYTPPVNVNPLFKPTQNITPGMDIPLASRPITPTAGTMPAGQQPVTVQAPDGTTKQVSPSDADHYVKLGAKILQGAA